MPKINFPISVSFGGIPLGGQLNVEGTYLIVQLLSPMEGQKSVRYGWASGVSKSPFWIDKCGSYTESAVKLGQQLLIEIYEEAQPEYKARQKEVKINELKRKIKEIENE